MDWHHDNYLLTDDSARLDLDAVCALLQSTYWAAQRSRATIQASLRHSLNFSLFRGGIQVGFARVVTDYATHGYLCDVIIAEGHRGRGVGTWMLRQILDHPALAGCRIDLFTRDAQEFYRRLGFGPHKFPCLVRYPSGYAGGSSPGPGT
jgi:ribosomal protein S18 acetylase RimI-like enzyme